MADNKMTLDEAVKLAQGNSSELSNEQLAEMNDAFKQGFFAGGHRNQATQDASELTIFESDVRIEQLNAQESYSPEELDSIISLANSISGFSSQGDAAKAVLAKAQSQKDALEAAPQSGNSGDEQGNDASELHSNEIIAEKGKEAEQKLDEVLAYVKANGRDPETVDSAKLDFVGENESSEDTMLNYQDQWNKAHPSEENIDILELGNAIRAGKDAEDYMKKHEEQNLESNAGNDDSTYDFGDESKDDLQAKAFQEKEELLESFDRSTSEGNYEYKAQRAALDKEYEEAGWKQIETNIISETNKYKIKNWYNPNTETEEEAEQRFSELNNDKVTEMEAKDDQILTPEQEAELKKLEDTQKSAEDLAKYDEENGINEITPEQLEKNSAEMDKVEAKSFNPFALDKDGKLVNPAFQEEYDAFKRLEITDDNGQALSAEEQEKYKQAMLEAAELEANIATRGGAKGDDVEAQYYSNFKDSIQKGIVSTAFAREVKEGKYSKKEQFANAFTSIVTNDKTKPLKATKTGVIANGTIVSASSEKYVDRIKNKIGEIPAVKKMNDKISSFDKNMTEKYGEKYVVGKRIAKTLGKTGWNVAKYAVVGATAGNIGIAVLAGVSARDAYKGLKTKASKDGMSLGQYAKSHKWEVTLAFATSAASALTAAAGLGALGDNAAQTVTPVLKTVTKTLAIAPKALTTGYHAAKLGAIKMGWMKGDAEKTKAAMKESAIQTAEATVGILAGTALGGWVNQTPVGQWLNGLVDHGHDNAEAPKAENTQPDQQQEASSQTTPEQEQQDPKSGIVDKDNDGIDDRVDPDHGQGWATANETQLDRVMDADPRGVNQILNDGKWHSSADLQTMMDEGKFTDEQLKSIHELAVKDFDAKGHIIDPELKAYYEDLAKQAAAAEQQAAAAEQQAQQEQNPPQEPTPESAPDANALDQDGAEAMTHDTISLNGMVPGEQLAGLEEEMAKAKESGDFSKVDAFMKENGIDANSDAGKGVQDYINAAKGLSATGGEIPDENFFNEGIAGVEPTSNLLDNHQVLGLAQDVEARFHETKDPDSFNQVVAQRVAEGTMTQGQADTMTKIYEETVAGHKGDHNDAIKDMIKTSEKDIKVENKELEAERKQEERQERQERSGNNNRGHDDMYGAPKPQGNDNNDNTIDFGERHGPSNPGVQDELNPRGDERPENPLSRAEIAAEEAARNAAAINAARQGFSGTERENFINNEMYKYHESQNPTLADNNTGGRHTEDSQRPTNNSREQISPRTYRDGGRS